MRTDQEKPVGKEIKGGWLEGTRMGHSGREMCNRKERRIPSHDRSDGWESGVYRDRHLEVKSEVHDRADSTCSFTKCFWRQSCKLGRSDPCLHERGRDGHWTKMTSQQGE